MKFGLHIGTRGVALDPDGLLAIAKKAEALGFDHLGFSDHLVIANKVESPYPYTKSRVWFAQDSGDCLDQLMTLSFVAAGTQHLRLLTSVMVIPHRPPMLTAKMLASADILSKGRLTVGLGVGWMAEEIALLGAPTFEQRGKLADETIAAMKILWTEHDPKYEGEFVSFADLKFEPKPIQRPHPPIWIGGETRPARRRAGQVGDGWYPVGNNPAAPYDGVERFAAGLAEVRQYADEARRDPARLDIGLLALWYRMGEVLENEDGERMAFTGDEEAILEDIGRYEAAGLRHLVIGFESDDLQRSLDQLDAFAEMIMLKV
ncbi:MAG: Alkanesulfonate monooxygenase [Alphaproteobacteria bacterium MarineAlpha4_Bin2]|nr:MAG: Alkanesulfonate monooxygenase [Alphaproteobacteria bacterium MarineAlpha4_Bin2]